jgi:hypothetical protein
MSNMAKVFVFTGQSNMVCNGSTLGGIPAELSVPDNRVLIWDTRNYVIEKYDGAQNSDTANAVDGSHKWGPEARFQYLYHLAHPEHFMCIMKYAKTGTTLGETAGQNWVPSQNELFTNVEDHLRSFRANLFCRGFTSVVTEAIINMQGESDGNDETLADAYEANKRSWLAEAASRWAGDNPNVKFIEGRIRAEINETPFYETVQAAQLATVSEMANGFLIDTDDLTVVVDGVHYDEASIVELGERMYNAYAGITDASIIYP